MQARKLMTRNPLRSLLGAAALFAATLTGTTAHAKFVFPYNHPDLDWYSIETEHFVVHYPVSKKTAEEGNDHYLTAEFSAAKSAKVAEEMWEPMCSEFNYFLKEKIHIVLLNQSDELEGFTIPPWDWIEISANKGKIFSSRMRGQMEWFSDVLVHEFAHVVSLKANGAIAEGADTFGTEVGGLYRDGINDVDTGVTLSFADNDSVFWTEGGAEYWSDNTGYNWWTPARDMNIRMTVLDDRLLTYDEWHTRAAKTSWNDGERYYQQGYSFGQYMRQRFGDETYANFAIEHGRRWRWAWETVIEDVLGVDAETLYNDWVAYVTLRYTAQYEAVKAEGEVMGREVTSDSYAWEFSDPAARDEWNKRRLWEREQDRERTGTWKIEPRVSPDGKYRGFINRGTVVVQAIEDDMVKAYTGFNSTDAVKSDRRGRMATTFPGDFENGWDFVPGKDAVVVTGSEDFDFKGALQAMQMKPEFDGYNWKQLWVFDLEPITKKQGNREYQTLERRGWLRQDGKTFQVMEEGTYRPIPNTKRGSNPAVAPDGNRIAYFEYSDGTQNLVTINMDGTDKKYITTFDDGTWMNQVDWSPDGKQLVFEVYRNYQQNLYTVNADGSDLKALMVDSWEEMDAHWAHDGNIYFTADPDLIHNIYKYDPKTERITKLTNVIGGAMSPQLTPEGNLLYGYYTAFGWKIYGLAGDEFLNKDVTEQFGLQVDDKLVAEQLAFKEDLTEWSGRSEKYKSSRSLMAPAASPQFKLENNTMTNWGLSGGFWFFMQDYVEKHGLYVMVTIGEDPVLLGQYFYQGWYPNFIVTAYHYEYKYDAGYLLDDDNDPSTTDDQSIWEIKNQQYANIGAAAISYPWSSALDLVAFGSALEYGFKSADSDSFERYLIEMELGLSANFSNNSYWYWSPNPYRGRNVELSYNHAWSDVVYEPYNGVAVDDGEVLDKYQYNKGELRWTEFVQIPTLGGIPWLVKANERHHVLQVDFRGGLVDRNVDVNDEFRAGGLHPYYSGRGSLRPNTLFAGYPGYSLSGETMAILNLAYRFPIGDTDHRFTTVGPLAIYGFYAQVGGTAGNLWSFRPPDDETQIYRSLYGDRIAYDPADIKREIPLIDEAYKNGNYLLYDAQVELRMTSTMFHTSNWDSFVRFAYGFNEIRGYGDVNGDDIYDTNDNAIGDELSNETEPSGLRVYIGFGTGW